VSLSSVGHPLHLAIVIDQRLPVGGGFQQPLNAALLAPKLQLLDWSVTEVPLAFRFPYGRSHAPWTV